MQRRRFQPIHATLLVVATLAGVLIGPIVGKMIQGSMGVMRGSVFILAILLIASMILWFVHNTNGINVERVAERLNQLSKPSEKSGATLRNLHYAILFRIQIALIRFHQWREARRRRKEDALPDSGVASAEKKKQNDKKRTLKKQIRSHPIEAVIFLAVLAGMVFLLLQAAKEVSSWMSGFEVSTFLKEHARLIWTVMLLTVGVAFVWWLLRQNKSASNRGRFEEYRAKTVRVITSPFLWVTISGVVALNILLAGMFTDYYSKLIPHLAFWAVNLGLVLGVVFLHKAPKEGKIIGKVILILCAVGFIGLHIRKKIVPWPELSAEEPGPRIVEVLRPTGRSASARVAPLSVEPHVAICTSESQRQMVQEIYNWFSGDTARIMANIAAAESDCMHVKSGQLNTNENTNGSIDRGLFQINNELHDEFADELDLDPKEVEDNIKLAKALVARQVRNGNDPYQDWNNSRECWEDRLCGGRGGARVSATPALTHTWPESGKCNLEYPAPWVEDHITAEADGAPTCWIEIPEGWRISIDRTEWTGPYEFQDQTGTVHPVPNDPGLCGLRIRVRYPLSQLRVRTTAGNSTTYKITWYPYYEEPPCK